MSIASFNLCKRCQKPGFLYSEGAVFEVKCEKCGEGVIAANTTDLRDRWNQKNPSPGPIDIFNAELANPTPIEPKPTIKSQPESVLQEAERIINGPRRDAYGPAHESFQRIASVWNAIGFKKLKEPLTGHDVALMMTGLKLCRESNAHSRDNLCDAAGYISLADLCWNAEHPKEPTY